MSLTSFVKMLFEHGRVRVPEFAPLDREEITLARRELEEFEPEYRTSLPGTPPAFVPVVAVQAAETLYRVCQCLVYRHLVVAEVLPPAPSAPSPTASDHYSADVVLRFLPDAWRLARDVSQEDPLVARLLELGNQFPLSSVGIPGVAGGAISPFLNDACLLAVYRDRIIQTADSSRLTDPRVQSAVREALGFYTDLSPKVAQAASESR